MIFNSFELPGPIIPPRKHPFAQPDFVRQIAALLQQNGIEGRCLEMEVLAEGVETPAQAEFLKLAGCDRAQGFFFHQPMTPTEAENCLTSRS